MEKYLRLLNPKTTNYEAIPSGNHGALTAADICIAMSYAKLTPLQDNLFRLKYLGANNIDNVELFSKLLLTKYQDKFIQAGVNMIYHLPILRVALVEFCLVSADYKPTERNREIISGFSDTTVRNHMKRHIDNVLTDLKEACELGEEKIFWQINKTN
ncbi:hypothetical protein [Acinetobacter nosocomialis]|uniref:hypothetical protein n=1 Tax=Acinetobacter nosocomialis TaxID=106654 RepID=UPI0005EAECFA|nr:hypothetical protein [Acinetobacter nosocomialis]